MAPRWRIPPWARSWKLILPLVVAVGIAGVVAFDLLAPKGTTRGQVAPVDQNATLLKTGSFEGADRFHRVSGDVALYEMADGRFVLRFDDYEATSGPDVYLYLSTSPDGTWSEGERSKVLVPGGAEDGQATVRGDFEVPLPEGSDPNPWQSIIVWCDDFRVEFGSADLASAT